MKRILLLTSPHMRGEDVRYAQKLLQKDGYLLDIADGEFGPNTAEACRSAKYTLGYPDRQVVGTFGTRLEEFLRGTKKPPLLYRRRAKKRAEQDFGIKALAEGLKWIGTKEHPFGSNQCPPFTTWYGVTGPWCAEFVSFCLDRAGFRYVSPRSERWAYCPYMVNDARNHRNGLRSINGRDARPGDIVLYDWDKDGVADHVGFFKKRTGIGTFDACEGNTGIGNDSNGGEVMIRHRSDRDVICYVRVG